MAAGLARASLVRRNERTAELFQSYRKLDRKLLALRRSQLQTQIVLRAFIAAMRKHKT